MIKKAVFPVAGLGTRFLPATKASPKEMLPIVDKPLIQYAVEEALRAGVTELVFITGKHKRAIEDHFDGAAELEAELEAAGKQELLKALRDVLPSYANCIYIRQPQARGLGHAVLCARPVLDEKPFAVILADDLIKSEVSATAQLVKHFEATGQSSIIGVQPVPAETVSRYGIVEYPAGEHNLSLARLASMVEKPSPEMAPSNMAAIGRYVFTPRILDELVNTRPGKGGEIQLTDAIVSLAGKEAVYAGVIEGSRFDCGSKLGYLQATMVYGLSHPEIGGQFKDWLADLSGSLGH